MMTKEERDNLQKEREEICARLKGDFPSPKDIRRKDEITSLLMTDGESDKIRFKFVRGRGGDKGLNTKKGYYRKGKVG